MESFNFQIEQNINEILADFHKNEDLSWHSSNIKEPATGQHTMVIFIKSFKNLFLNFLFKINLL